MPRRIRYKTLKPGFICDIVQINKHEPPFTRAKFIHRTGGYLIFKIDPCDILLGDDGKPQITGTLAIYDQDSIDIKPSSILQAAALRKERLNRIAAVRNQ
jgi:hypothetical protein